MRTVDVLGCGLALVSCLAGCVAQGPAAAAADGGAATTITVDPYCVRSIRGTSELNREAYFAICDHGPNFDGRCGSRERYEWLVEENGITFGRVLGVVDGLDPYFKAIREDPKRPGFVDVAHLETQLRPYLREPSAAFRKAMHGRLDVAAHEGDNAFPDFMGTYVSKAAAAETKPSRLPENLDAAAHLTAAALRHKYTDFDRPRYCELVNEPHWSYWEDPHLARWHLKTMAAVHRDVPGVLVGGPCLSVAYFYRQQYSAFRGLRTFIDNTRCSLDFYSFHVYDFLGEKDGDFAGRITGGLPLESVLDLLQNHTMNAYGKEVGVVVSEHGGYGGNDLVAKLAKANFPEKGFDWEMKKRSIDDFNMVSSVIANTLVFMDHPQTVRKAVPFILFHGMPWDPAFYASLYVPRDYDNDAAEWLPTQKIMFYRLLRDLKGHRVAGACPDPDIQLRAFADGETLFVVLNNLSNVAKPVSLRMPPPARMLVRRFGRRPDFTPYLTEEPLPALDGLKLAARETVVVRAEYADALAPRRTVDEVPCYGDRIAAPVAGETRFTVRVPRDRPLDYATLRIGVSRPADAGWDVAVTLNGAPLEVPLEQCAERLTDDGHEYASCKFVALEPAAVRAENTIGISFPDGKPGSVGAVVIRAGCRTR